MTWLASGTITHNIKAQALQLLSTRIDVSKHRGVSLLKSYKANLLCFVELGISTQCIGFK